MGTSGFLKVTLELVAVSSNLQGRVSCDFSSRGIVGKLEGEKSPLLGQTVKRFLKEEVFFIVSQCNLSFSLLKT